MVKLLKILVNLLDTVFYRPIQVVGGPSDTVQILLDLSSES